MVKNMASVILLLFAFTFVAEAKPELVLVLGKDNVQLGHHIDALLYGIGLQGKLINIDLSEMRKVFGINIIETAEEVEDEQWPGQAIQLMKLRLFPRKVGAHKVSQLHFEDLSSEENNIFVSHGINKSRNSETSINTKTNISSNNPWEREQVILSFEIKTADNYASLHYEDFKIPGFEVFSFPEKKTKSHQDGIDYTTLNLRWALFPLIPGQHNIGIPAIEYHKYGKKLRTYYLPIQTINIKPLPAYIPPTMPVGKISISSKPQDNALLYPGTIYNWQVDIVSYGVAPKWVPSITSKIRTRENIHFSSKNSTQTKIFESHDLITSVSHNIPFKLLENGWVSLPEINAQYFDATSGKIIKITLVQKQLLAISFTWRAIASTITLVLVLFFIIYLYHKLSLMIQRNRNYRLAIKKVESANCYLDLRNSLHALSNTEGWPDNLNIREWSNIWETTCPHKNNGISDRMDEALRILSKACYGNKEEDEFIILKGELLHCICSR